MSRLFKASLLLTFFFGLNKLVALVRQIIIARQFGLTPAIDAFNVANNFPDLIVSLISGGALAFAFIPVFCKYRQNFGLPTSWKLFSNIANLVFITTALLSIVIAIFAETIVSAQWGIAPGFTPSQQSLVVQIMRINLLAMLFFSISSLVMATLQANKHFLFPAIAPILFNLGQIFGAIVLAPIFGVYGLAYGVFIGSVMHLLIQIPAALHFKFRWTLVVDFKDKYVQQVLFLMGPRMLTVLLIQFIFIARDNLASRLEAGAVSALTYAYFIMQVPETLIGTAIGTALLPTLSDLEASGNLREFQAVLNRTIRVIIATSMIFVIVLSLSLGPLVETIFGFTPEQTNLLVWVTRAYLLGLVGHSLLEVTSRAYYAVYNAKTPLIATFLRSIIFIVLSLVFLNHYGVIGIALADSISVTVELIILLVLLSQHMRGLLSMSDTLIRVAGGCVLASFLMLAVLRFIPLSPLALVLVGGGLSALVYLPFIWKELKVLVRL